MSRRFRTLVLASLAGCVGCSPGDDSRILEAREVGVLAQSPLIVGRDGGGSALMWGRSVWTFGDTVTSKADADGATWHHNSYSFTTDLVARDGIDGLVEPTDAAGAPRYLIAPTEDEAAFNAGHRGDDCRVKP